MQECHILKAIGQDREKAGFHTPGHKSSTGFCAIFPSAAADLTELSYTDDLSSPSGAIALAQRDIAELTGAKRSYILTDGSTSGVMAMLYAAGRRSGKFIVARNCHKSVWNACAVLGIEPVIVTGVETDGVMQPPSAEQIRSLICADEGISGLIVTSPDYYGNIAPLGDYSDILHTAGKLLLVDGAHGGHLAFEGGGYAGRYADMWVDGVHKSMPALTQGAIAHTNNLQLQPRLEEGLGIFRTSSPSYPIMASVEYAVKYCAANAAQTESVKGMAEALRRRLRQCGYSVYPSADWTKLAVDLSPLGIDIALACGYLEKNGIYSEFNDGRYILFYLSVMTSQGDLELLGQALDALAGESSLRTGAGRGRRFFFADAPSYGYLKALAADSEYIPLGRAAGRVSAANAGISPPCIPIVAAGEVITPSAAAALSAEEHVFGTEGGMIKVVK